VGGEKAVEAIRGWRNTRFNTLVFTHGHLDHVGGCAAFIREAERVGLPQPRIGGMKTSRRVSIAMNSLMARGIFAHTANESAFMTSEAGDGD
jgi:metal-dependent hydrolase (beta-lactamase superfamily II)|tara:strand:+ start:418 stop:693 length:276 start_codon:yes stop_codon:yes gene_type:complete